MKKATQITPAEFQILEILWASSERLSVGQVQARLFDSRTLAYTTVMTVLDKLERKGSVERVKRGKAYHYRAQVSRGQVLDRLLADFARHYFRGDLQELENFLSGTGPPRPSAVSGPVSELGVELL